MDEMPHQEFKNWIEYFRRRPHGWRDDQRAAYIMMSMGMKSKPDQVFQSLHVVREEVDASERARAEQIKRNAFIRRFVTPMLENKDDTSNS